MKLNLGCGKEYLPEYVNIDAVKEFIADVYMDLRVTPYPYPENSIDGIRAKDILEHFCQPDAERIFAYWISLLKPGGEIEVIVPDINVITKGFTGELMIRLIFGETEFGGVQTGEFGAHKWGYDEVSLMNLFWKNHVDVIVCENIDTTNLHIRGKKQ